jgi:hypothetical protein
MGVRFQLFFFKAPRPGDHFLNELESDPNFSKQGFLSVL